MVYENYDLWRIFVGIALLFCVPTCFEFWSFVIKYERSKKHENIRSTR